MKNNKGKQKTSRAWGRSASIALLCSLSVLGVTPGATAVPVQWLPAQSCGTSADINDRVYYGQNFDIRFHAGQFCMRTRGNVVAVFQNDGNLVVYKNYHESGQRAVWSSRTSGLGNEASLAFQADGNIVIYRSSGAVAWATHTAGRQGIEGEFVIQDDRNLVLYRYPGESHEHIPQNAVWESGTSGS